MSLLITLVVLLVIVCLVVWLIRTAPLEKLGPAFPADVIRWAFYAILVIVVVVYLWKYVPGL